MEKRVRFSKNIVTEALDHYFAPRVSRNFGANNDAPSNKGFVALPGTFPNRNYGSSSTEIMNQAMPYYPNDNNRELDNHLSNVQEALEYCYNNNRNSKSYEEPDILNFPMKYRNDDQLIQNTNYYQDRDVHKPWVYRGDTTPRNELQIAARFNTHRPTEDIWMPQRHNHDELMMNTSFPAEINGFDNNFGPSQPVYTNIERINRNRIDENYEYHFQTNRRHMQPSLEPSVSLSRIYDRPSRTIENGQRIRSISGNRRPIQKVDDGFVCVRNPDFCQDSSENNGYESRNVRTDEQRSYRAAFINKQRLPTYRSYTRTAFSKSPSPINISKPRKPQAIARVENFKIIRKQKRENQKKKLSRYDGDKSFAKYHWVKGDSTINPHSLIKRHGMVPLLKADRKAKYTYVKSPATSVNTKQATVARLGVSTQKISKNKPEAVVSKIEKKKFYTRKVILKKRQVALMNRQQAEKTRAKKQELKDAGLFGEAEEGHIKYNPEKYWTTWWSKYAYIENSIDKTVANDESVMARLKFQCDLSDPNLDSKINAAYKKGLLQFEQTSSITEINYEHRCDAVDTMKWLKILEDKEFQSFLVSKELKHITQIIKKERENKKRQALLHQSVICRWHHSKLMADSDEECTNDEKGFAKYTQKNKIFHYMVLESFNELKKITAEDWPGFEEFYKSLQ